MLRCLPGHVYEKRVVCPDWAEHCLALINDNNDSGGEGGGDYDNDNNDTVLPALYYQYTTLSLWLLPHFCLHVNIFLCRILDIPCFQYSL